MLLSLVILSENIWYFNQTLDPQNSRSFNTGCSIWCACVCWVPSATWWRRQFSYIPWAERNKNLQLPHEPSQPLPSFLAFSHPLNAGVDEIPVLWLQIHTRSDLNGLFFQLCAYLLYIKLQESKIHYSSCHWKQNLWVVRENNSFLLVLVVARHIICTHTHKPKIFYCGLVQLINPKSVCFYISPSSFSALFVFWAF